MQPKTWSTPPRKWRILKLGKKYTIYFDHNKKIRTRLIQTSAKGYNFLDLDTHKCFLKNAMFASNYQNHTATGELWFYVNVFLTIE
jgi:hypothetical protein